MKAITIHQPWASLIAHGYKRFETRGWRTNYRGPIAIHASKKRDMEFIWELKNKYPEIWKAIPTFPTGAIVAVAELVECWLIGEHSIFEEKSGRAIVIDQQERDFGWYERGRYAWELSKIRRIDPIPAKGQQGLWNWKEGEE